MGWIKRSLRGLIYGLPLVVATGCHELGHMGDSLGNIYGDRRQTEIVGEVQSINTRQREIELRTDDRRTSIVRYDDQTRVVYRDRDYAVANLERGDYVAVQVQSGTPGNLYTDLVRVRESVQDRAGTGSRGRLERLQGTVESVDYTRGEFELRDEYGKRILVTLPYSARRGDVDRLRSLQRGDRVRVEGQFLNPDRFELETFA